MPQEVPNQHPPSVVARDLRRGDCVLLPIGRIDRWCDVMALMRASPVEMHLVVTPPDESAAFGVQYPAELWSMTPEPPPVVQMSLF